MREFRLFLRHYGPQLVSVAATFFYILIGILISLIIIAIILGSIYTMIKVLDVLFFKIYGEVYSWTHYLL